MVRAPSVRVATVAGDRARPNEDAVGTAAGLVAVLDGVTAPAGLATGCRHGPGWYASRLAANIVAGYTDAADAGLADLLAGAIEAVCGEHGSTCDLDHPDTPQSTVTMLRVGDARCDYLVLCDSTIVLDRGGSVTAVTDLRIRTVTRPLRPPATSPAEALGSAAHADRIRALNVAKRRYVNRPDGYWIASVDPAAARYAVQGQLARTGPGRLTRAALLTDGVSCVVDKYGLVDWPGLLDLADRHGPEHIVRLARNAEDADPAGRRYPRSKVHDDASIAYCLLG